MSQDTESALIDKISFLTAEQQERVLKFVKEIEVKEPSEGFVIRLQFEPFEIHCFAKYQGKSGTGYGVSSDDDIVQILRHYLREHHHLLIGRPSAQRTIQEIGSLYPLIPERTLPVKGRDIDTGLPSSREISSIEVREQIAPAIQSQIRSFAVNFKFLP
jgi:actin-like ATPase involved in cell morphogenesis